MRLRVTRPGFRPSWGGRLFMGTLEGPLTELNQDQKAGGRAPPAVGGAPKPLPSLFPEKKGGGRRMGGT